MITARRLAMPRHSFAAEVVCPNNLEIDDIVHSHERCACLNNAIGMGYAQIKKSTWPSLRNKIQAMQRHPS
jgi:hypothetical protein